MLVSTKPILHYIQDHCIPYNWGRNIAIKHQSYVFICKVVETWIYTQTHLIIVSLSYIHCCTRENIRFVEVPKYVTPQFIEKIITNMRDSFDDSQIFIMEDMTHRYAFDLLDN